MDYLYCKLHLFNDMKTVPFSGWNHNSRFVHYKYRKQCSQMGRNKDPSTCICRLNHVILTRVITKLPNSEQSYKGNVKTHKYINKQYQSTTGKL